MSAGTHTWHEVSLGDVCEFKYGKSLPEDERRHGEYEVFGSNGRVGSHDKAVTDGPTIVIGRKGSFGEVHYSPKGCWPIDTTYYVDRSGTEQDLRWLMHRLSGLGLTKINRSKTIPGLNREDAYRLRLLLPPVSEQRRISEILDRAESLRAKRRGALAQLNALAHSIFHDLMLASATDSRNIKHVRLSNVTTRITDGTHLTPPFVDSGVPFIFVKNVKNGEIDFQTDKFITEGEHAQLYKRCPVEPGDVLYTIVGATYGQAVLVGSFTRFAFQRHIAHLKPDPTKVLAEFLGILMQLPVVKRQADRWARGAAQPTINLKELREFEIPLPMLSLQRDFARRIAGVNNLRGSYRASLAALDVLFVSLRHRAFRGEL